MQLDRILTQTARRLARAGLGLRPRPERTEGCEGIPHMQGDVRTKPLMSIREARLFERLAARLAVAAPDLTLHAGVSLDAFLVASDRTGRDALTGLVVDMLIADERGRPLIVLLRVGGSDPAGQLRRLDALLGSHLPIIDIPARPVAGEIWAAIAATLPRETAP
ncbi:MAG: hypothetical protein WBA25_05305, partial [Jannaschia sp.]